MVFSEIFSTLWTHVFVLLRPMLKWLLRKVSGKCELLRITYEEQPGASQTKRIEKSLRQSKSTYLRTLASIDNFVLEEAVQEIVKQKEILTDVHVKFEDTIRRCLAYIQGFNHLAAEVDNKRKVKFSSQNPDHEASLMKLWGLYMGDQKLESRISHQWTDLGFQGNDPSTDFRGMGILGLEQLIYFAEKYNNEAKSVFSKSSHPKYGFSYAIVGINITELQNRLMTKRKLRTHFYNLEKRSPSLDDYHEVYCYLMSEFVKLWLSEKPRDVMEFSRIRDKFYRNVRSMLQEPTTTLMADFQRR